MSNSLGFEETIVAIASPTTPAPRGVVRLSGDSCNDIIRQMGLCQSLPQSATRSSRTLDLGQPLGEIPIDVLHWPSGRSYTGQPSAELHTFGSLPILQRVVEQAITAGARAARPGEFTLRAFLAGRLDLTQAEAVLGVIEAEQPGSLNHALSQLAGNLSKPLNQIRDQLLDLLADVEAGLDFVDEDIEFIDDTTLVTRLEAIAQLLIATASQLRSRDAADAMVPVVLCGEPNAGKSCLLNRLAGQSAAIVSSTAGTTRDVVTIESSLGGQTVKYYDTAGIESVDDVLRQAAQQQTDQAIEQAAMRLWCIDAAADDFEQKLGRLCEQMRRRKREGAYDLLVFGKSDLINGGDDASIAHRLNIADQPFDDAVRCSAVSGEGIDDLFAAMTRWMNQTDREQTGSIVGTAARCGQSLRSAISAVESAISQVQSASGHEFVSAELRTAAHCVGEVTGEVYNDDILDRVFGRFCIGK